MQCRVQSSNTVYIPVAAEPWPHRDAVLCINSLIDINVKWQEAVGAICGLLPWRL